ncbi:hypothetical protein IFM89_034737 [Coptis chinensis]|uniref:Pentatricopeptide repeat-containing protein n=1 Tax=Coptis chinensis TaxID=261450 RepID=A0A835HA52_9MAGN|nr:hypothetical protein IFM89_034737 [Coptis chinensis]
MEGANLKRNCWACEFYSPLCTDLGKDDEVGRIWKICDPNPHVEECLVAIEAWGKVYANHKMLTKGKDLAKHMAESGQRLDPFMWDALVKLYVEAGEVPAYGFRDRMKGDNVFPNKPMQAKLAKVDAFRKTAISDILD